MEDRKRREGKDMLDSPVNTIISMLKMIYEQEGIHTSPFSPPHTLNVAVMGLHT